MTDTATTPSAAGGENPCRTIEEAFYQAHLARENALVDAVLAAQLIPEDLTAGASFHVKPSIALPGDEPLALLEVEVRATRSVGTDPVAEDAVAGERPFLRARGLVRPLKADHTPQPRKAQRWIPLPTEIVGTLLGRAHVA